MEFITQSNNLNDYLECSEVIGCNNLEIQGIARNLSQGAENEIELVKTTYEFVRDEIRHSSDAGKSNVTCKASDVLKYKHGLCFANSHLLAAILRALDKSFGHSTGFCYQKLEFEVGFELHGLNAVFIKSIHKWIRLDARGNEGSVNAQFSLDKEILAYPVDEEKGEVNFPTIYSEPNEKVIEILKGSRSLTEAVEKIISTDWLKIVI